MVQIITNVSHIKFTFLLFSLGTALNGFSQLTLSGTISDENGNTVPFANVLVDDSEKYAISDDNGFFSITGLENRSYRIRFSSIGFKTLVRTIDGSSNSALVLSVVMTTQTESLDEVIVQGKSELSIISAQPLAVSAIDAKLFQNANIDAVNLLDRANGVRVRQSGGLGSDVNISIQGAQGNAIRRYFDGLPIQYLAAGLDINNLPVNQIERIDIYRGVTPLEVGTDALGGGINIVPKQIQGDYVDVSYQFGSFNTHRPSVNLFHTNTKDFFFSSNFFLNYSDNNYKINAQNFNEEERRATEIIEAERRHSLFRSTYVDFALGVRNKPWAKELKISFVNDRSFREINTGIVFNPVRPIAAVTQENEGITTRLDYSVALSDKLLLKTKTNIGRYIQSALDSTRVIFDWSGNRLESVDGNGAELLSGPADITIDRDVFLQRTTLKYNITDAHKITVSNLFIDQQREGRNVFVDLNDDPLRFPAQLQQNYSGIQWDGMWFNTLLETVLTYKNYNYKADATSLENVIDGAFERQQLNNNYHGANVAVKYNIDTNLFLRGSYEYAYRLPEEIELFGNQSTIGSNVALEPEQSDNYNIGGLYKAKLFNTVPVALEVNGFYRYQQDRILLLASGFDLARHFNEEEVEIKGVDGYLAVRPLKNLKANLAATYQDVRIQSALEASEADVIGTRVPNIPSFFMSFDAHYTIEGPLGERDLLRFSYYYDYITEFSSIREANALRNIANFVPDQHINSLEATYTTTSGKWNVSARINNIFDDDVFDNFRVQRPGRNVNVKLRYTIQ